MAKTRKASKTRQRRRKTNRRSTRRQQKGGMTCNQCGANMSIIQGVWECPNGHKMPVLRRS